MLNIKPILDIRIILNIIMLVLCLFYYNFYICLRIDTLYRLFID